MDTPKGRYGWRRARTVPRIPRLIVWSWYTRSLWASRALCRPWTPLQVIGSGRLWISWTEVASAPPTQRVFALVGSPRPDFRVPKVDRFCNTRRLLGGGRLVVDERKQFYGRTRRKVADRGATMRFLGERDGAAAVVGAKGHFATAGEARARDNATITMRFGSWSLASIRGTAMAVTIAT